MAASASAGLGTSSSITDIPTVTVQEVGGGDAVGPSVNAPVVGPALVVDPAPVVGPAPVVWPSDTDLVFVLGSNRLILTVQSPPVHAIIHNAFDNTRASLFFDHSFPDATMMPTLLRGCYLTAAAESRNPRALVIHNRLIQEAGYMDTLIRLVSRFSLHAGQH